MFLYVMGASVVLAVAIAVVAHFRSKAASAPPADSDVDTEEFDGTVGEEFPNPTSPRADLIELTDENFEAEMAKSDLPIVVEFFADWCSACRTQGPLMEQAAAKFAGKARFFKVDHDKFNSLLTQANVEKIPTTSMPWARSSTSWLPTATRASRSVPTARTCSCWTPPPTKPSENQVFVIGSSQATGVQQPRKRPIRRKVPAFALILFALMGSFFWQLFYYMF